MIKRCTGSQDVQQPWQTEAIFQHNRTQYACFSTIPLTFSSSIIVSRRIFLCTFGPSGDSRMIISCFFSALIPKFLERQSFEKVAKFVDYRFSAMSPRKKICIVGLILRPCAFPLQQFFWDLPKRFCFQHLLNFHRRGTKSLLSTPNCQSDPEWNSKTKLEIKYLLAGSLHMVWLLNHRKKVWLYATCEYLQISECCLLIQKFSPASIVGLSNRKRFQRQFSSLQFSSGWGLSNEKRKTREANLAPLSVPTPSCRLCILSWFEDIVCGTLWGQQAESIAYSDKTNSSVGLVSDIDQRSTVEVRILLFLRESLSQDLLRLWESSIECVRSFWQSTLGAKYHPELH